MKKDDFFKLGAEMETYYQEKHGQTYEYYLESSVQETAAFANLTDALFFILFQKKNDLVYGSLGAVFGISPSAAHKNYDKFNNLLQEVLEKKSLARSIMHKCESVQKHGKRGKRIIDRWDGKCN